MIEPNDVMKVDDKDWEQFKKEAAKDELFYSGPGGRSSAVSTRRGYSESPTRISPRAKSGSSISRVRGW